MAGPWEKYQQAEPTGPWSKFQAKEEKPRSDIENLILGRPIHQDGRPSTPVTDTLVNGATFGLADEVGGAGAGVGGTIKALLTGEDPKAGYLDAYNRSVERNRAGRTAFAEENPGAALGTELLGGAASLGGVVKTIAKAPTLLSAVGRSMGFGGVAGGVAGAGNAEGGLENRGEGALAGAMIGGAIGGAIPAVGYGVGRGLQFGRNVLGMQNPQRQAQTLVSRAMERDSLPNPLQNPADLPGKPATLMEAGGQNVKRLADQVNVQGGPGGQRMAQFLEGRQAEQPTRIADDIRNSLSKSVDTYGTEAALRAERSALGNPAYERAWAYPGNTSDRLSRFAQEPIVQQGMNRGVKLARLESLANDTPFDPNAYAITGFNAAGDPVIGKVPTWRTWQAAKEGLDAMLERDSFGRVLPTKDNMAIQNVQRSLLKELDALNPEYKAAREAWAGPTEQMQALNQGDNFMRLDPEQIAQNMSRMSGDAKEAYRMAAARALQDKMDSVKGQGDITRRIFNDTRTKNQIKTVFGDKAYANFERAMNAERAMADTRQFVSGNSRTAQRLMDKEDLAADMANDFLTGGKNNVLYGMARRGINRSRGINDATGDEIAKILTEATPTGRQLIAKTLLEAQQRGTRNQEQVLGAASIANLLIGQNTAREMAPRAR